MLGTSLTRSVTAQRRSPQQLRQIFGLINSIDDTRRGASVAIVNSQTEPGITYGYLAERSRCVADVMAANIDPSVQSIGKKRNA